MVCSSPGGLSSPARLSSTIRSSSSFTPPGTPPSLDIEILDETKEGIVEKNESKENDVTKEVIKAVLEKSDKSCQGILEKMNQDHAKLMEELFGKKKTVEEK